MPSQPQDSVARAAGYASVRIAGEMECNIVLRSRRKQPRLILSSNNTALACTLTRFLQRYWMEVRSTLYRRELSKCSR